MVIRIIINIMHLMVLFVSNGVLLHSSTVYMNQRIGHEPSPSCILALCSDTKCSIYSYVKHFEYVYIKSTVYFYHDL